MCISRFKIRLLKSVPLAIAGTVVVALGVGPTDATVDDALAEPMSTQSPSNPLALIYQSEQAGAKGEMVDHRRTYQQIVEEHAADSFWGQWGRLNLVRWHLAAATLAAPDAAEEILAQLPTELIQSSLANQRMLWENILAIHKQVDRMLSEESDHEASFVLANRVYVPQRLRSDMQWAMTLIGQRFEDQRQTERGTSFFRSLLAAVDQPALQAGCLQQIARLSLASGDVAGAAAAARGYWLTCVEQPDHLPTAIDLIIAVMRERGAGTTALQAFQQRQMQGASVATFDPDILRPNQGPGNPAALFSHERIEAARTSLEQARMHLMNGDLAMAAVLLNETLESSDIALDQRDRALMLTRMALALYDGHLHRISRYERYRAEAARGEATTNPLKALIQDTDADQVNANGNP